MSTEPGLTPEDRATLADMADRGARPYARRTGGGRPAEPPLPDAEPEDGRGLTAAHCNAIRQAAHDGLTAREIAAVTSAIDSPNTANAHATGRCQHIEPGVEPVERACREYDEVDRRECTRLRLACALGVGVMEIHRETGRSRQTIYDHVDGECSHGGSA